MKFKIKTNLVSGIVMGLLSIFLLVTMPQQIRVPAFDSGAPSPRIIPMICTILMLVFSVVLIIQSLVFKKEKVVEFDWQKEKPAIILILALCVYVALIITIGYVLASAIIFCLILFYCGERKWYMFVYTIVAAVLIYFLFKKVFLINLPSGLLPF